jgi:indole-3-glycerol phosphate synthase
VSARAATVLERILTETRAEIDRRRREGLSPGPSARTLPAGAFAAALVDAASGPDGIGVIAEFKRRSPSAGSLAEDPHLPDVVTAYERGGAAALSILTEKPNFGGSLDDLAAARIATSLPLLRKDFIVDEVQLREAAAAGADAVLLIVAALPAAELSALSAAADQLGLDALVEVHDEEELEIALGAGARLIGINNRDLRDFSVDVARTERLLGRIPDGTIVVSESGIAEPAQLARLRDAGVQAVLVGERLMRAPDPEGALRSLRSL